MVPKDARPRRPAADAPTLLNPRGPVTENVSAKPPQQRPELPEFWNHRFRQGLTPWDAGRVPEDFSRFVEARPAGGRALVPGCGAAYEAGLLDAGDWSADALDFSPEAIATAQRTLPAFRGRFLCADFFAFAVDTPYDLIYERAFLCALPRGLWPAYGPRTAALLKAGGLLAGFFLIDATALKGPPFGVADDELVAMLSPWFERIEDRPALDSIGPFVGRERWMVWRRR